MNLKWSAFGFGIFVVGLLVTALVYAQSSGTQDAWGPGSRYGRMYNPQTVQTITGEVVSVDKFAPTMGMSGGRMDSSGGAMGMRGGAMGMHGRAMGMSSGMHLMVKTATETISVHLGPSWFLEKQEVQFKPGDQVKVTGSRITFDGKPAIIASEVSKGDRVLKLRDASGVPVWSGRGAR